MAIGVVGAFAAYFTLIPEDVGHPARLTAAVAAIMAAGWMTQALPLPVTALVPLALFPVLGREAEESASDVMRGIGASYGNPIIFLFLGGFMLALAVQRWNLHKRIALHIIGTIISTPPNVLFAAHTRDVHGVNISFGSWMLVGVRLGAIFLFLAWVLLAKVIFRPEITEIPGGREMIKDELTKLGTMSSGEKRVLAIFLLAAVSWVGVLLIFPEVQPISEHGIAIVVALLLFILPSGAAPGVRLLDWASANNLPWGCCCSSEAAWRCRHSSPRAA